LAELKKGAKTSVGGCLRRIFNSVLWIGHSSSDVNDITVSRVGNLNG